VIQDRGLIRWVIGQTYVEERHMVETWELIMGLMESLGLRPKAKDI